MKPNHRWDQNKCWVLHSFPSPGTVRINNHLDCDWFGVGGITVCLGLSVHPATLPHLLRFCLPSSGQSCSWCISIDDVFPSNLKRSSSLSYYSEMSFSVSQAAPADPQALRQSRRSKPRSARAANSDHSCSVLKRCMRSLNIPMLR